MKQFDPMKGLFFFSLLVFLLSCNPSLNKEGDSLGGDTEVATAEMENTDLGYDSALAAKLGADDYGMKNYIVCFLKPGKKKLMLVQEAEELDQKHLMFVNEQVDLGNLSLMGLFLGSQDIYEQLVFDVSDMDQAKSIMQKDPKVAEGIVVPEYYHWYGPAALQELKPLHERISKIKFGAEAPKADE